ALVDRLKEVTTDLHGITLRCRRDFPANDLWPRLGFRAVGERPGRGAGAMPLTLWAWDHDHPTLFSDWGEEVDATRLPAALDTNVIFDLQDPPSEKSEESLALHADWVEDAYEFCRTPEYLNDVDRAQDPRERQRRRAFG